ncbi:MAG TPA: NAD-dependent epimerase/dehydratase family protein [Solirubrobacteraceae bacterium]
MSDGHLLAASASKPTAGATCFLTGATGFIGGHLAERLVREGHRVRCLVRATSDTSLLDALDVELAVGDLTSLSSLLDAADGCRYALHCGAFVSDWATAKEIAAINVEGTRHVLEAAVASGMERFIHFSTTDVYGYPGGVAIDETYQPTRFRNWYAQTKLEAEAAVRRATVAQSVAAVILRPATVYGPRSKEVVGEIARAIRNRSMLLIDGGRAVAGLCYVENLIDAALVALQHQNAPGQAFNVSDGLGVTWKQFTEDIAHGLGCAAPRLSMPYWISTAVGFSLEYSYRLLRGASGLTTPPLLSRQAVQVMGSDQDFSNRKARELLGWEPRVDYETGLRATIEWLQAEHFSHA